MPINTNSCAPALPGWLDETQINSSPTSLSELEEIVTDVGRSPWLWGHAVTFGHSAAAIASFTRPTRRSAMRCSGRADSASASHAGTVIGAELGLAGASVGRSLLS